MAQIRWFDAPAHKKLRVVCIGESCNAPSTYTRQNRSSPAINARRSLLAGRGGKSKRDILQRHVRRKANANKVRSFRRFLPWDTAVYVFPSHVPGDRLINFEIRLHVASAHLNPTRSTEVLISETREGLEFNTRRRCVAVCLSGGTAQNFFTVFSCLCFFLALLCASLCAYS